MPMHHYPGAESDQPPAPAAPGPSGTTIFQNLKSQRKSPAANRAERKH